MTDMKKAREGGYLKTTPEPEKEKGGWGRILLWLAAIATILLLLFGDNILGRISKKFKSNKPAVEQTETLNVPDDLVDVNGVVFEALPKADKIIKEIERLPVFKQKTTIEELVPLVREYAFRENPKLNPPVQFKIEEHEVDGLWHAIRVRLLLVRYMSAAGEQFNERLLVYHDGKLTPFASAFGGYGLMSAVVMDGKLYYTYSWGSGIHRSHIGRLSRDARDIRIIVSGGYSSTDLFVRNVDGRIRVEAGKFTGFNSWKVESQVGWLKAKESSLAIVDETGAEVPPQFGVMGTN